MKSRLSRRRGRLSVKLLDSQEHVLHGTVEGRCSSSVTRAANDGFSRTFRLRFESAHETNVDECDDCDGCGGTRRARMRMQMEAGRHFSKKWLTFDDVREKRSAKVIAQIKLREELECAES
jgi:hypothetical protein